MVSLLTIDRTCMEFVHLGLGLNFVAAEPLLVLLMFWMIFFVFFLGSLKMSQAFLACVPTFVVP